MERRLFRRRGERWGTVGPKVGDLSRRIVPWLSRRRPPLRKPAPAPTRERTAARILWEKRARHPLAAAPGSGDELAAGDAQPPAAAFKDLEAKYGCPSGGSGRFRNGYYQTREGRLLVLQVRAPAAGTGLDSNRRLLEAVRAEVRRLNPVSYDPSMRVGYSGEVAELVEEQSALVSDLAASTAVVTVLVLVALWVFFR